MYNLKSYTTFLIAVIFFIGCNNNNKNTTIVKFRNDLSNSGVYISEPIKNQPKIKWKFKTDDEIRSSPTIVDNLLYIGSSDGYLYALE